MNKVQFFSDINLVALQESVNSWLGANRDIEIIHTNMNSVIKPDLLGSTEGNEKYIFYIHYRSSENQEQGVAEAALEAGLTKLPAAGKEELDVLPDTSGLSVSNSGEPTQPA